MNELQRQSYIKALGLTPWVAREPLSGAAPTPWADWPEVAAVEPDVKPTATDVATNLHSDQNRAEGADASVGQGVVSAAVSAEAAKAHQDSVTASANVTARSAPPSMRVTLQAHQVGSMWLLVEQEDAQAPGLGREAQQLMNNMLAVFPGERRGTRRFIWPISDIAMDDDALKQTFHSFTCALGGRILLCAGQVSVEKMLGQPRYKPVGDKPIILPVSSLAEMLENPAEHKRLTWQAMLAADFHA